MSKPCRQKSACDKRREDGHVDRGGSADLSVTLRVTVNSKKNVVSIVVFLICAVITLATVMNVFGDNSDVEDKAKAAACWEKKDCKYAKRALVRTPIGQTFTFEGGGRSFDVTCRRSAIVFGDYTCTAEPQK